MMFIRYGQSLGTYLCLLFIWFATRRYIEYQDGYRWRPGFVAWASLATLKVESPLSPVFFKYYNSMQPKPLSRLATLFYKFDTNVTHTYADNYSLSLDQADHEEQTLKLGYLDGELDEFVKEEGDKLFSFNLLVSNRIGLFRLLPDSRPSKCPGKNSIEQHVHSPRVTDQTLQASIVICYYNEAPSALMRTIHSILARSNHALIKEILVIDDFSEDGYDMRHIEPHINSELVKFVRTHKREGLIRARLFGASLSQGDVLIFLDSHVEANVGWLDPLMDAIKDNRTTIVCPMIDLINAETMVYSASPMVKGGLSWALHFKWDSVPSEDLKTYEDFAKPIKTATMAGGLYAIDKNFFYELGAYDPGMNLWGGENVEMSLRAWMCGGRIVILPCSRLGHIFRKTRPYGPDPGEPDSLLYNSHRSARVWLDHYIDKFYEASPEARDLDSGDVRERISLREKLMCENFTWFLESVYPKLKAQLDKEDRESKMKDLYKLSDTERAGRKDEL